MFFILVNATMKLDLVWNISDVFNGLMAIPNLIGVLALSGSEVWITKERDCYVPITYFPNIKNIYCSVFMLIKM